MKNILRRSRAAVLSAALAGGFLAFPAAVDAQGSTAAQASTTAQGADAAAAVKARLNKKEFQNVQVTVDPSGVATLTGTVDLFENKTDADRRARRAKGVTAVRNNIEVGGEQVSDAEIQRKLAPQLAYSRIDQGNVFDAILMGVQNGVVTLGGHAHDYPSRDAAVGLASSTPGVKDVIDDIQVDPVSPMDWDIRLRVARAIYGFPSLNRYAIDPVRPIRISVQNGNVALFGNVDSQQDKQVAYIQANGVPGVFSVRNYLTVQGQETEKQETAPQQK